MSTTIIKQYNPPQPYEPRKLFASIFASCLAASAPSGAAELTAQRVCDDIAPWLQSKAEVTSRDIRLRAHSHLQRYDPDAAIIYKHHDIIH